MVAERVEDSLLLLDEALAFLASWIFLLMVTSDSEAFFLLSLATVTDFVDGHFALILAKSALAFFMVLKRAFLFFRARASFFWRTATSPLALAFSFSVTFF